MENLQEEIWKETSIYGIPFKVSNLGKVISFDRLIDVENKPKRTIKGRLISPYPQSNGYLSFGVKFNGKATRIVVHQLVAIAFIDKDYKDKKLVVNHKDGNKINNNVSNLEVITFSENIKHASSLFLLPHGESHPKAKLTEREVLEIRISKKKYKDLMKTYNVSKSTIDAIKSLRTWRHI